LFSLFSFVALPCNWITVTGHKLDPHISGDPKHETLDLEKCKDKCVNESTFICAAVNYRQSDRRCELLEENDQTATPQTRSNYQYLLRPICAGSLVHYKSFSLSEGPVIQQTLNTHLLKLVN
jgi:hypothetical protein